MLSHHKLIAEYETQKNVSLSEIGMGLYQGWKKQHTCFLGLIVFLVLLGYFGFYWVILGFIGFLLLVLNSIFSSISMFK